MITQRVDPEDPALGATVAKLRALAAYVDELVVLTLVARPVDPPGQRPCEGVRRERPAAARRSPRQPARPGAPPQARRRPRAHVADLRRARRARDAPASRSLAPLVHALAAVTDAAARGAARDEDSQRLRPVVPVAVAQGRRDRPRHRGARASGRRRVQTTGSLQARLARAYVAGQGPRDRDRGGAAPRRRPGRSRAARAVADGRRGERIGKSSQR